MLHLKKKITEKHFELLFTTAVKREIRDQSKHKPADEHFKCDP